VTPFAPSADRPGFDALGFDPAPGSTGRVESLSTAYQGVGAALADAHESLARIGTDAGLWQGGAADLFRDKLGELPDYLDKANRSLNAAADALRRWHADLVPMQRAANDLEVQARAARERLRSAESNPDLGLANRVFPDEGSLREAQHRLAAAVARLRAAQDDLEAIRDQAERLRRQHEELARQIAEALRAAKDIAPEKPGMFERLGEAVGAALSAVADSLAHVGELAGNIIANIADVLGDISTMLGVVSGVLELIPGVGTVVGTVIDAVALGLSVTALQGHIVGDLLGADIPPETYFLDIAAIGLGVTSLVTPVPGVGLGLAVGNLGGQALGEALTDGEAGTFYDNLGTYWAPRNPAQWATYGADLFIPGAGLAVPFWNAVEEGIAETNGDR
jgi:hypothetical protein